MNENDFAYLIFLMCAVGVSFHFGRDLGISHTIDYLQEKGIIELDDWK